MAVSKVVLNGTTLMDTTQKTVTAGAMLNGTTALKNDGTDITGNIATKTSSNMTVSGATVTAPAGYYASDASKSVSSMTLPTSTAASATSGYTSKATVSRSTSDQYINIPTGYNSAGAYYKVSAVANGTEGTPTATKGTVSNHQVSITPSVTNTTGYITGGTKTGTAVTVTASELASGSKSISANGTGIDVVGYSTVDVAVPSGGGNVFLVTLEFDDETGYWVPNQTLDDIATAYGQGKTIVVNCDEDISFVSAEGKYWNNYGTFEYFVREEKNNSTIVVVQDYTLYQNDTVELNWEAEYGEITDGNEMYFGDNPEITPYVGYGEVDSAVLR